MEVLALVRSIPVLSIPQLPQITQKRTGFTIRTFARKEFAKQSRKREQIPIKSPIDNHNGFKDESFANSDGDEDKTKEPINNLVAENSIRYPARSTVLLACTFTSGLIAGLGLIIRQVVLLPKSVVGFEIWHVELIIGLVLLISSSRYLLLKAWPDFAESSEAANVQVLTSLQPLDYLVVAFLPGISEIQSWFLITKILVGLTGVALSWGTITSFWDQLEECTAGCCHLWCLAFGEWQKIFVCSLRNLPQASRLVLARVKLGLKIGNICGAFIWVCNDRLIQCRRANGFTCSEQFGRRDHMALYIKISEADMRHAYHFWRAVCIRLDL
ncbi:hypothetical protein RJ641_002695 [Dillenia turbinata]|uniref:Uncharacterized protein n=1 Tax=Dillenia turbinata TaxID=194707 RepID=A0AAN8ZAN3_9MAGN